MRQNNRYLCNICRKYLLVFVEKSIQTTRASGKYRDYRDLGVKALSKKEEPNVCLDTRFFLILFLNLSPLPAAKRGVKKTSTLTNVWLFLFCQGFSSRQILSNVLTLFKSSGAKEPVYLCHIYVHRLLPTNIYDIPVTLITFLHIYF